MPQQRLYYEYIDSDLVPFWYVLTFQNCEINWEKRIFFFTPIRPFEYMERHEYDESLISTSIHLSDFVVNPAYPDEIGINLNSVRKRIERNGLDPYVVRQFIITLPDINELLTMIPVHRKLTLITS